MTSLVIQTAFLGDVVLTTPLLAALAERHGPLDVVTTPAAAPLIETHPAVRRVIPYDKRGLNRGARGLLTLAGTLRAEHYEAAYLPHRSLRTAALALLANIPRRIGFHDGWPLLYTEVRRRPADGHEIDRLLAMVEGQPPRSATPSLTMTTADRTAAEAFLGEHGVRPPYVVLAPGSIWGSKRWTYYSELGAALSAQVAIVVIGSRDDVPLGNAIVETVVARGGTAASACGRLSLRESAAVIAGAQLLVTNDSAPLHFASAVGTRVVAIFGPTVPAFGFGPRGPRDQVAEVQGLPCRPCSHHGPPVCPLVHHLCMKSLRVEDVMQAIEETGALRRRD